ncbi:MAG: ComF family protein [candidate division WOR-3 bacterium]|nr:ComF family protein [candidate division WOR-3 bacterium]
MILKILKHLSGALLDFIFPPRCYGCDKDIEQGFICDKCFIQVTTNVLGICSVCGMPKDWDEQCEHPNFKSGVRTQFLSRIRALGKYQMPYKGLVHNFKYHNKRKIAQVLGLGLGNVINSDPILSRADFIVPIPLHPARLRERGYNQSLLLAQETAFNSGLTLLDCLQRKKNTKSQTQLDYTARTENIREAYRLKQDLNVSLENKRVILIDDVITTGATLSEASRILLQNGAKEVYGLVVATARVRELI